MIMLKNVKDEKHYYERLNIGITMSKMWNTLQSKSEYGSDKSEKGYQQVAKIMAGNIARGLNMNSDLAEILTMCKGSFFPAYGEQGKKVILQYLKEKGITISEYDLARQYIEYDLTQSGNIITPKFDELLKELFDPNIKSKTPEVEVAKICNQTIQDIKAIERVSGINKVDLLYKASKNVERTSLERGEPTCSSKVNELVNSIPKTITEAISQIDVKKIYSALDQFIEFYGTDKLKGIYEYIGTEEIEL